MGSRFETYCTTPEQKAKVVIITFSVRRYEFMTRMTFVAIFPTFKNFLFKILPSIHKPVPICMIVTSQRNYPISALPLKKT